MAGPVRSVFTRDQRDDLEWALGDEYKQLLPILEQVVAGYRANHGYIRVSQMA